MSDLDRIRIIRDKLQILLAKRRSHSLEILEEDEDSEKSILQTSKTKKRNKSIDPKRSISNSSTTYLHKKSISTANLNSQIPKTTNPRSLSKDHPTSVPKNRPNKWLTKEVLEGKRGRSGLGVRKVRGVKRVKTEKVLEKLKQVGKDLKVVLNRNFGREKGLIKKLGRTCEEIEEDMPIVELERDNVKGALEYYQRSKATRNKTIDFSKRNPACTKIDQTDQILDELHWFNQMHGTTDPDKFFMKDIIGYDGDFNHKCKSWMLKSLKNIKYKDQLKDYFVFKPHRNGSKIDLL